LLAISMAISLQKQEAQLLLGWIALFVTFK